MTIDLYINGEVYGHDVSVTVTTSGHYLASTRVNESFREVVRGNGYLGVATITATSLDGALKGLRGELMKVYEFGGVRGVDIPLKSSPQPEKVQYRLDLTREQALDVFALLYDNVHFKVIDANPGLDQVMKMLKAYGLADERHDLKEVKDILD